MKIAPELLRLYAVTDRSWLNGRTLAEQVSEAIDGGATIIQLREKTLSEQDFLEEAKVIANICHSKNVPLIINDNVEIALLSGADGVHVGQDDLACEKARAILGPDKIIGVSAHNPEEALLAYKQGADYLGCGAVFGSSTKTNVHPITAEILQAVTASVPIPVVAIGGITCENINQLNGCGLAGAAVISAIFAQPNIKAAATKLYELTGAL